MKKRLLERVDGGYSHFKGGYPPYGHFIYLITIRQDFDLII